MFRFRLAVRPVAFAARRAPPGLTQKRGMSVFSTDRLAGQTVLVTGSSSGIGAATAELFAKCGSNVVLLARRKDNLEAVREKCEAALAEGNFKGRVMAIEADMQDSKAIGEVLPKIAAEGLTLDILVNNAGLVRGREHMGDISAEDVNVMFQTNVIGLIELTQAAVRDFKKRDAGMIINLGSVAGREPYVGGSIYCATKAAVAAVSGSLLRELVNTNIRVAEIQPGMVETEFTVVRYRGDQERADNEYNGLTPLSGHDVAEQIVWVASRPPHVQVAEILMFPTNQASSSLNYRKPQK